MKRPVRERSGRALNTELLHLLSRSQVVSNHLAHARVHQQGGCTELQCQQSSLVFQCIDMPDRITHCIDWTQVSSLPWGWAGSNPQHSNHMVDLSGDPPSASVIWPLSTNSGVIQRAHEQKTHSSTWGTPRI